MISRGLRSEAAKKEYCQSKARSENGIAVIVNFLESVKLVAVF